MPLDRRWFHPICILQLLTMFSTPSITTRTAISTVLWVAVVCASVRGRWLIAHGGWWSNDTLVKVMCVSMHFSQHHGLLKLREFLWSPGLENVANFSAASYNLLCLTWWKRVYIDIWRWWWGMWSPTILGDMGEKHQGWNLVCACCWILLKAGRE